MVSLALPLAHFAASSGVFCLPGTGPLSLVFSGFIAQRNANYNETGQILQTLKRDRTQQLERTDFEQVMLEPFARVQGTNLVNYKINSRWFISKDAAGKTVCTKMQPPGPQPTDDGCIASSAVPQRRGTQGPLEVTWWQCSPGAMGNLTVAAAGSSTLPQDMLHWGGFTPIVSQ